MLHSMTGVLDRFPQLRGRKLIVFDGTCVLCSGFFAFVLRHDRAAAFDFAVAQSDLGEALYAYYGLKEADYETNLVILDGKLLAELDAFAAVMREIGGPWRLLAAGAWLPRRVKSWLYARIARNRFALLGRRETCYMPTPEVRARFLA